MPEFAFRSGVCYFPGRSVEGSDPLESGERGCVSSFLICFGKKTWFFCRAAQDWGVLSITGPNRLHNRLPVPRFFSRRKEHTLLLESSAGAVGFLNFSLSRHGQSSTGVFAYV